MNAVQYNSWKSWLESHPKTLCAMKGLNKWLKVLCYFMYSLLLVVTGVFNIDLLMRFLIVPGVLFCVLSMFRWIYNAPRPYEALAIDPLIIKNTKGKSFPSRHIFSVFMIAMCWLYYCVPVGCILLVCGVLMACIRVLGGVHFPKDVIAGALFAVMGGFFGFWILPWP